MIFVEWEEGSAVFKTLFAFGDSLSDAGNDYYVDGGTDPVSPYYKGHFSNGPTWIEDLSQMLGLGPLTPSIKGGHDFAFGGAETGPTLIEGANPGDLLGQVAQYGLKYPQYQGGLYSIEIGGNDILKAVDELRAGEISASTVSTVVTQAAANTVHAIQTLFGLGARNLMFYEVPDLGLTPHVRAEAAESPWVQNLASGLANWFNQSVLSPSSRWSAWASGSTTCPPMLISIWSPAICPLAHQLTADIAYHTLV